jgi:ribonucleoside-diphosphate reductase alpha chain
MLEQATLNQINKNTNTDTQNTTSGISADTPLKKDLMKATDSGLQFNRHFTVEGIDPMSEAAGILWEKRTASITGVNGEMIFEQKDVEVPQDWSQTATNIVVNKYFRGATDTPDRETSIRQLISRVACTITGWGESRNYFSSAQDAVIFKDELTHLLVTQKASFNSPVWFNVGVEPHPQCSACFINSVDDKMEAILGC